MKQLLVIASFILLLFTGCQKEMAVDPVDNTVNTALEKPIKPGTISGGLTLDDTDLKLDLNIQWLPVSKAIHYVVTVVNTQASITTSELSASFPDVMSVEPESNVTINIVAYGERKNGNQFTAGTGTKTFTFIYNPPSNIDITGSTAPNSQEYIDLTAGWNEILGAVSYNCTLTRTLNGTTTEFNYEVTSASLSATNISSKHADASSLLKVDAINDQGVIIGTGTKTITYTYTPPSVPNIPLTGAYTPYENYYLDLLVQWNTVEGAVTYHCINYMSHKSNDGEQVFISDHEYLGWNMGNINPITPGVFNIITIEAKNSSGELIACGTQIFTYNP